MSLAWADEVLRLTQLFQERHLVPVIPHPVRFSIAVCYSGEHNAPEGEPNELIN